MSHFFAPSFLLKCLTRLTLLLMFAAPLVAQDRPDSPRSDGDPLADQGAPEPLDDEAPELTYREIVSKLRENEKSISHLYSTIPLGFPQRQKLVLSQISELESSNANLRDQVNVAAVKAFRQAPLADSAVTRAVFGMIAQHLDAPGSNGRFDPRQALELAEMMLVELTPKSQTVSIGIKDVAYQAFRASFAIEDFDRADLYLKKINAIHVTLPAIIQQRLDYAKQEWEQESKLRLAEATADDLPRVKFETSEGDFVVELFEDQAPQSVGNFISLVEKKFYDDLSFFQVKPGGYSRTGCNQNDGTGDVGYLIPCECTQDDRRPHFSGTLSMVTTGRDSGSSQFLICHQSSPDRDGKNTAFGRVIDGMEVVLRLKPADARNSASRSVEPSSIIRASVIRKRDHSYSPTRIDKTDSGTIPSDVPGDSVQDRSQSDK